MLSKQHGANTVPFFIRHFFQRLKRLKHLKRLKRLSEFVDILLSLRDINLPACAYMNVYVNFFS